MKILIDTNIYLDFYRSNKDTIPLLNELSSHFEKVILTDQIIQEFERNRETVIRALKRQFEIESKLENISSAFLQNLDEFNALKTVREAYEDRRREVVRSIDRILTNPEHDPIFIFFRDLVNYSRSNDSILYLSEAIVKAAQKRKLVGNPPTSNGHSIGDEINWEIVLENTRENIVIVGRDNTYTKNIGFLKKEFHKHTGFFIQDLTNSITAALSIIGISTPGTLHDMEASMIQDLAGSSEYWQHLQLPSGD